MIRNFELFCNLKFIKKSDSELFTESVSSMKPQEQSCPFCGARHCCFLHAVYERDLIILKHGIPVVLNLTVLRLICSSCHHTHAFLPAYLIPYGSYSLFFILKVLRLYFLHSLTIRQLCERFSIAVSTLYAWIRLFQQQKILWLGILKHASTSPFDFLSLLFDSDSFLEDFFHLAKVSFLQPFRITARSRLP